MSAWRLRITRYTDAEFAKLSYEDKRTLRGGLWHPPAYVGFQAPVPKPPDYSTPAKVTARCWERSTHSAGRWWEPKDRDFAKLYRAFRKTPCTR